MTDNRRGKWYLCLHCQALGKTYVEVKYRMVAHVYKHHLALDKAPYYCTLCLLRCTTKSALLNHVSKYSRHRVARSKLGQEDEHRFLVENKNPAILVPGVDFRELDHHEASRLVPSKCPSDAGSVVSEADGTQLQVQAATAANSMQTNSNGLVSVQVTPEILAQLLNSKSSPSFQGTNELLGQTSFIPYSPTPSSSLPAYTPTPISAVAPSMSKPSSQQFGMPCLSQSGSASVTPYQPCHTNKQKLIDTPDPSPLQVTPKVILPLLGESEVATIKPALQTPLLDPVRHGSSHMVSLASLLSTSTTEVVRSSLNTPILGSSHDLYDQIMGDTSSEFDYEFDDDGSVARSTHKDVATRVDQAIQTEDPTNEPQPKKMRVEDPPPPLSLQR